MKPQFMVDDEAVTHVRELYIKPGLPVFDLVPGPLNEHLEECYNQIGRPSVTRSTVWDIYLDILHTVQARATLLPSLPTLAAIQATDAAVALPLLQGQGDLPFNEETDRYYMGGVGGGLGLGGLWVRFEPRTEETDSTADAIHAQRLNELDDEEGWDVIEGGPDVVVSDFSDDEPGDDEDDYEDDWA